MKAKTLPVNLPVPANNKETIKQILCALKVSLKQLCCVPDQDAFKFCRSATQMTPL